ncbi:MAG: hypothetical protein JW973_10515 [Bacteroidales bacterium]|nr:hypothetical protein [Bacteroidales bacterium]
MALTVYLQVSAQTSNDPVNARYAGMADAGVVVPDVWSGFHNQAGLAYISGLSLSVHYESRFCIPENSIKALTIGIPVLKGTLGLNYSMFGYAKYFESRTGLAYGRMLGKRFAAGIQINHLMIRQSADYGNMHTVIPEGGFLAQPLDDLYIGFHIFNPAQQHFPQCHDQAIPSLLQIGIGYRIIDNVFLSAEVEKETDKKQVIKVGVEYEMIRHFNLRLGVSTASTYRYALGIGYVYRRINLDFALSHHQWLGFTPYITLGYSVNNEK